MVEYSGLGSRGFFSRFQPAGLRDRALRSTSTERSELVVRASEYGSVTRFTSTAPVLGAYTVTSYR